MRHVKLAVIALMLVSLSGFAFAGVEDDFAKKASDKVKKLVKKHNLTVVGFETVQQAIGNGTRKHAPSVIIDARPMKKYQMAHIPSALALPDSEIGTLYKEVLGSVDKSRELIVYCGGFKCAKSPKVAGILMKKGHKNVKVYAAGMPEWQSESYVELDTNVAKALFDKQSAALFIDARPWKKFAGSTIVGSLGVPDPDFDNYAKFMPSEKNAPIITFCGGYACHKSHSVANKLLKLGYTNVKVYAAGFPAWKKAGHPITGSGAKVKTAEKKAAAVQKGFLKPGADKGSVDGEWFVKNYKTFPKSVTIVDTRDAKSYKAGHILGAINIPTDNIKPEALAKAIPQTGEVVFVCNTGTKAMESQDFLAKIKYDRLDYVMYLDANVECDAKGNCKIEPNEPLGI
jgi:rhodanese-related sulfurtransferase